ncbi:GNAT family N-acetyltransferase [Opitutus terrae]|uniref:GCN5-related N-acetyltransferase n=1 Tax=Opitutus terrae (strain DSM 11246 / JCM 15787 / PB90-1) TaxID=452637 RepID=B1ZP80_OPITP|nr:GNAT family N-acetyltransferase [Opitutus terrae]ACB77569.1 GCN5-related N-acetyltransferase [Opitutus terrae PB90-1]
MPLTWREATAADLPLLAEWNHQLIRDEGHRNAMTVPELIERMQGWLRAEYQAIVFCAAGEPVAYALYRHDDESLYLRQFFVRRDRRRLGLGRAAITALRHEIWPQETRLTLDVLCGNTAGIAFWHAVGYRDYCLTLEIPPA